MAHDYSVPTIKTLFGEAIECAYPTCDEPLVFHDRGANTVVCQIAHIRSESANGPRHDPTYPVHLLDEPENLLLLCGKHHPPVDRHESLYPTDELLAWKAEQVARATLGGTPISDAEARLFARLSNEERQALADIARTARRAVEDAVAAVHGRVAEQYEQQAESLRSLQRRIGPMWEVDDEGNRGE